MKHWALQYMGQPWTHDQDCFIWFCRIQKEQFDRDLPSLDVDHDRLIRYAAQVMAGNIKKSFGWQSTSTPAEGDAVFLSQRNRSHHIGTVIFPGRKMRVLHALEGIGVVCSELLELQLNGWKIKGYYTRAG